MTTNDQTGATVGDHAQARVQAAADRVPDLTVSVVVRRRRVKNVLAVLVADRRSWRLGRLRFGPLRPAWVIVAPAAADAATENALCGAIAHEAGHVVLRHALIGWVRFRVCLAAYVAAFSYVAAASGSWGRPIATGLAMGLVWLLIAMFFQRREELDADAAAVRLVGLDATLAFLAYCRAVDPRWMPDRRWLRRLVCVADAHPSSDDRIRVARRAAAVRRTP
jgi:Zn-dependent protease with chaperone function